MDEYEGIPEGIGAYYRGVVELNGKEVPTEALIVRGPGNVFYHKAFLIPTEHGVGAILLDFTLN